jgi:putative resolvase
MLFSSFGVTFPILDREEEHSPEQELTDDLISVSVWFAGTLYGMRLHKQEELLACAQSVRHNP